MLRDKIARGIVEKCVNDNLDVQAMPDDFAYAFADAAIAVFKTWMSGDFTTEAIREAWADYRPDTSITLAHARHIRNAFIREVEHKE